MIIVKPPETHEDGGNLANRHRGGGKGPVAVVDELEEHQSRVVIWAQNPESFCDGYHEESMARGETAWRTSVLARIFGVATSTFQRR